MIVLLSFVLLGCSIRSYENGNASIKDLETGWFRATATGTLNTSKSDATEMMILRIAEYCLENDIPYFKIYNARGRLRRHYSQWVGPYGIPTGAKTARGTSYEATAEFFPISEADRSQFSNQSIVIVKKAIEKYKHLRVNNE